MNQLPLRTSLAGLAALGLVSCNTPPASPQASADVSARYPINVAPSMSSLRLPLQRPGDQLDPNMSSQLETFVAEYRGHGVGALSISAPRNWEDTSRQLADRVVGLGVAPNRILIGTNEQPQPGAEVTLTFIRYVAETKPCGDWSDDLAQTLQNRPMPNLGCATQQNIAAMVADPRDLMAPKPMTPGDTQRALTVLDKYRKGEPTTTTRSQDESGAVSRVGGN
jgi:pilus assembly protein CpaD